MASRLIARAERTHLRAWVRLAGVAAWLLICLPAHGLSRLLGRKSGWRRRFLGAAARIMGMDVRIKGHPIHHNVLYIANHVSWLDILVLAGASGSAFVAKAEMADWPLIGWLCRLNNTVFVAREARLDVAAQAAALADALATGEPVTLFPEGTTGDGLALLPFRSSLVAVVSPPPPGIAIQPVAIDYGGAVPDIAWVGDEPIGRNALRLLSRPGRTPVTLWFMPPLDHADFPDRKAITAHSRAAIARHLGHG